MLILKLRPKVTTIRRVLKFEPATPTNRACNERESAVIRSRFCLKYLQYISRLYFRTKTHASTVQLRYGVCTYCTFIPNLHPGKRALGQARQWHFRRHCSGSAAADLESTTRPAFRDTCLGPKEQ